MNEEPTVEELVRHLQTELEKTTEIDDEKERVNRIWQIEVAIQESLAFRQRYVELVESGIEPVVIEQAVRLILSQKESNEGDFVEQISGDICIHCDAQLDDEIDFCTGCGKYQ